MSSERLQNEIRKLDAVGRLNLGKERAGEQFEVNEAPDGTIVLTPVTMIPKRELWLWRNSEALASVKRGLEQSARGEAEYVGSFAEYADDEIED